jgi:beta-lactamase regulating signal transducer with metallopeptidase domain
MRETLNLCITLANRCGDAWWNFTSLMFLQVTVLVAVLFCLDLVLRHKVRAVVRYWIWLLVLAKLVLPTSARTPASVAYWLPPSQIASDEIPLETVDAVAFSSDTHTYPAADDASIAPLPSRLPSPLPPPPIPLARVDAKAIVFGVWLSAVGVLLGMVWRRVRRVRRIADEATAAPAELVALLVECLPSVSLQPGRVRLRVTDRLGSPAICGFRRPTILLPRHGLEKLDREQIRLIFLHELAHWQRGDLQMNCLQTVLQVFYFYNPPVWIANAMVRRLREQAVDETVLVMTRGEAERYASTLLDLAAFSRLPAESTLRLIGVVEQPGALAGRIRRIVGRPIPKTARVGLAGLAAIVAIGLLVVPMGCSERPESPSYTENDPATDAVVDKFLDLGQAMRHYVDAHQRFPSAATHGKEGQPLLSWRVELLPYLGEQDLYDQFHHDEPWDSEHNKPLLKKMSEAFFNPRVGDLDGKTVFLVPTGKETMYFDDQGATPEQITDGTLSTISMVEVDAEHAVPRTKPADFPVDKSKPDAGHARGMARTLPGGFDTAMLWSLFTRAGGETIDWPVPTSEIGRGVMPGIDADVSSAGGQVGYPADVVARFKSSKKPLPHSVEENVAERLQRIARSLLHEMERHGQFPPSPICDKSGQPLLSWRVKMLRDLNEGALYDQFHLDEPWDSKHNLPLVEKIPDVYLDPHVGRLGGKTVFLLPTGKKTIFFDDQAATEKEMTFVDSRIKAITDGVDKRIMLVVADAEHAVPWTKPDDLPIDSASPARGLERWPNHFFMMALADSQILLLPDYVEPTRLWDFFTRAGDEGDAPPPDASGDPAR